MHQDTITSAAAGAAITSPAWLHMLSDWSNVAGTLLPILGVVWLIVQIGIKIWEVRRSK